MSLISEVGRGSFKNRFIMISIYVGLILMGITMVIPFMITLTGSMSNAFDYERFSPFPKYLWSSPDRFVKCLVPYFNGTRGWQRQMSAYAPEKPSYWSSWSLIGRDTDGVERFAVAYIDKGNRKIAADYAEFMDTYPLSDCFAAATQIDTITFLMEKFSMEYLARHPDEKLSGKQLRLKALKLLGSEWGLPFNSFYSINFGTEVGYPMDFQSWFPPNSSPKYRTYNDFKAAVSAHIFTPGIKGKWFRYLKEKKFSGEKLFPVTPSAPADVRKLWLEFKKEYAPASPTIPYALRAAWYAYLDSEEVSLLNNGEKFSINLYNKLAGTKYNRLEDTPFPVPASFGEGIQRFWKKYQQERYPLRLITIHPTPELNRQFQEFVKGILRQLKIANGLLGTSYKDWSEINLSEKPVQGVTTEENNYRDLWKNFVKTLPVEQKLFSSSEIEFQKFLLKKYGSLEKINREYGWNLKYIEEAFPQFMPAYALTFAQNEINMTFGPVLDNYKIIFDFMIFNGNAILVTFLLIAMTIAFTLTVNPLAAYALSRFNLRGHNQILIFMLATMAFPAMVSAIPAYLLMRDLGLLNTFWALVLPGAANGMAIFILKGFFDSLPMELFEAATIDGASEMQIFRIVAMPMVKPILAINCLNAFIAAYNGWEWALIICQDKSMWTIAVWMYQAAQWWSASPWIVSAGFIVVSIPTMIIFISCQKIILRGIIIPSMK